MRKTSDKQAQILVGKVYLVTDGSGLESNHVGVIQSTSGIPFDFFDHIEPGRYKPFDRRTEVLLRDRYTGRYFTMFKNNLIFHEQLNRADIKKDDRPVMRNYFLSENTERGTGWITPTALVLVRDYCDRYHWTDTFSLDSDRIQCRFWQADGLEYPDEGGARYLHRSNIKAINRFKYWQPYNEEKYGVTWFYNSDLVGMMSMARAI